LCDIETGFWKLTHWKGPTYFFQNWFSDNNVHNVINIWHTEWNSFGMLGYILKWHLVSISFEGPVHIWTWHNVLSKQGQTMCLSKNETRKAWHVWKKKLVVCFGMNTMLNIIFITFILLGCVSMWQATHF